MGVPPILIHFMLDFPWNKPFILGYPHGYGNHIFFRYINPLQLVQESVSFFCLAMLML